MRRSLHAVVGTFVLATAVLLPTGPASADGVRSDQQWYLNALKVPQAHEISTGAGVTVALIDTGVDPHQDVKSNLLAGVDELDGKGNGLSDKVGHGTEMAGLIAAHGRGSRGMIGIAPSAKVLSIKISDQHDKVPTAPLVSGIKYAIAHKAQVINIAAETGPSFELLDAIKAAEAANIVIVAGSGNHGATLVQYPAAADGVLAVGGTTRNGKHLSYSSSGSQIQICAPGEDVETLAPGNKYIFSSGTSDSTAIVSGAVALVRAKFPQLSAAEVIHRITATADDNGPPGRDNECGFGELNIVKALTADVPPVGGTASASPSATTPVASAPGAGDGAAAPPVTDSKGNSAPLVVGVVVVVLLAGGVVGFVARRRRQRRA